MFLTTRIPAVGPWEEQTPLKANRGKLFFQSYPPDWPLSAPPVFLHPVSKRLPLRFRPRPPPAAGLGVPGSFQFFQGRYDGIYFVPLFIKFWQSLLGFRSEITILIIIIILIRWHFGIRPSHRRDFSFLLYIAFPYR